MIAKPLLIIAGFTSLGLGILGMVLPVLPTTSFVLLAAFCFAKSSDRFYQMLLNNKVFGPMIRQWEANRSMSRRAKRFALVSIVASGALSIYLINSLWVAVMVAGLLAIPMWIVMRIPTAEDLLSVTEGSAGEGGCPLAPNKKLTS